MEADTQDINISSDYLLSQVSKIGTEEKAGAMVIKYNFNNKLVDLISNVPLSIGQLKILEAALSTVIKDSRDLNPSIIAEYQDHVNKLCSRYVQGYIAGHHAQIKIGQ